jgi:hypothetical protein
MPRLDARTFGPCDSAPVFVVVEGFNELRLKDARVQKLFKENVRHLRAMRKDLSFHSWSKIRRARDIIRQLNWAEELHEAIRPHIGEYVRKKAEEQRAEKKEEGPKRKAIAKKKQKT